MNSTAENLATFHSTERAMETVRQLAVRVGLTKSAVTRLLEQGKLDFVIIGARKFIPAGAWQTFIHNNTVKASWAEETKVHNASGAQREVAITSTGQKTAAAASAALAQRTAQRLKSASRNFSNTARGAPAPVIPLKLS